MVLCKLFLQGKCHYGSKCISEHFDIKQVIITDVQAAINGKQWPLSTYGPFNYKRSMPNFIEDQSFEEVRMLYYEAKQKDSIEQFHHQFNKEALEARNKMKALWQLTPDIIAVVANVYDTPSDFNSSGVKGTKTTNANKPFGLTNANAATNNAALIFPKSNTSNNGFGPAAISNSIFGGFTFGGQQQQQTSIFGQTAKPANSVFNNSNRMNDLLQLTSDMIEVGKNMYDTPSDSSSCGVTGAKTTNINNTIGLTNANAATNNAASIFAKSNTSNNGFGAATSSTFGGQQQQQQQTSIFGQAAKTANSIFGGGTNTMNNQQTNSIFGQQQNQSKIFAQPQQQQQTQTSTFGQQNTQNSNIFRQASQATQPPQGLFAQSAQTMQQCKCQCKCFKLGNAIAPRNNATITQSIKNEVNEVINNKIWPFSTYGPFELRPSLPNYIEDLSFEELRLKYYKAKKKDRLKKYERDVLKLRTKYNAKTAELLSFTQNITDTLFKIQQIPAYTTCCGLKFMSTNVIGKIIKNPADCENAWKEIDKFIMDLILVDMLPYNLVEGPLFQRIPFANDKSYKIKNKDYYRFSLMPETFKKVKAKVMTKLELAKWISITAHIWYSLDNSFVVFVAHFLEENIRKIVILDASVLEEDFEDANITDKLQETITNFNLAHKIHCYIYKSLNTTMESEQNKTLECIKPILQLTIDKAILENQYITEIIRKSQLMQNQISDNNTQSRPHQKETNTKWINLYLKMKDVMNKNPESELYKNQKINIKTLTPEEKLLLNDLVNILELCYETFKDLNSKLSTISQIIPSIGILKTKLNELNAKEDLKNVLLQELNTNFKCIENTKNLITATFLDPRFKSQYLNETQLHIAKNEIGNFFNDYKFKNDLNKIEEISEKLQLLETTFKDKDNAALKANDQINNSIQNELSQYIKEPLKHRNFNIIEYWLRSNFQNLKECSLKYLTAPPTTEAYQEFINDGAKLYNERCTVLKEFNSDELLFCHYNIKIFNRDY